MLYNYNKYIYIFVFLLFVTTLLFYINSVITFNKIENIKHEKYNLEAKTVQEKLKTLINEKQNATLSIALILAENKMVKELLQLKDSSHAAKLAKKALKLSQHSDYKNTWFQIINKNGTSVYRSWTNKTGDSLLNVRLNVVKMLKNPQILSTISTGKFDMTFKSMIPIYNNQEFIGIIEVITHFNSIAKQLVESNIQPLILVDKRYKKQLSKPFTKLFIDDYYVANLNANQKLMNFVQKNGVEHYINQEGYKIEGNHFISFFKLLDIKNQDMGHFIFFQDINTINISGIESLKFVSKVIFLSLILIIFVSISVIIFIAHKNQIQAVNKSLEKNNQELERRVKLEVAKNRKKDLMLEKQNRLIALGEMLENIAHQWRQPLSAIATSASGLKLKYEIEENVSQEDRNECLDNIVDNTKHLSMTIDDFRNFFQNDKQKQEFSIAQNIRKTYSIIKALYKSREIHIVFNLDESIQYYGYEREFSQVIINLFNNAKDALVNNTNLEYKYVEVSMHKEEKNIIISFKDNAGGVPEKINTKIFEPYFTTKHQKQGTGIGLYMSQQIIVDHFNGSLFNQNETITIDHKTYTCANFIIKLPV